MSRTRNWRNTTALIAVAALGLSACGGGDDDTDAVPAAEDTADEPADEPADDSSSQASDSSDDASSGNGETIRSIDDVPPACRDELASFLRDIEPIVSDIDWTTATISDMEAIGAEFEERAAEFDDASLAAGCDDLSFEDDNSFDVIIEFARDEAPDTVGFLTFLDDFTSAMSDTIDDTLGGDSASDDDGADAGFDDCDDGIAYVEQLMADYETITEAPLGEIAKLGELGMLMMSCTPEQMEFFDSDEVNAFLGG